MPDKALTLVTPTNGVLPVGNLKNVDNWRAFVHQLIPVIVTILVTANVVTENTATAWIPFVLAIADNMLAAGNVNDRLRKAVYAAVGVLQTGGLLTTLLTNYAPEYVSIGGAVLTIVSASLARFYTPTTTMEPAVRTGPRVVNVEP